MTEPWGFPAVMAVDAAREGFSIKDRCLFFDQRDNHFYILVFKMGPEDTIRL